MYLTYGLVNIRGKEIRHFLGEFESLEGAKAMANRATSGNISFAYVNDSRGSTVYCVPVDARKAVLNLQVQEDSMLDAADDERPGETGLTVGKSV